MLPFNSGLVSQPFMVLQICDGINNMTIKFHLREKTWFYLFVELLKEPTAVIYLKKKKRYM